MFGAISIMLPIAAYVVLMKNEPTSIVAEDSIFKAAIDGDPIAMYRVGARKSDNRDAYAWFLVSGEHIASAAVPHSVEMNRTEMEINTAIQRFRERFGDAERKDAELRAESVRKLIRPVS